MGCCPIHHLSEYLGLFLLQVHAGSVPYLLKVPHLARDIPPPQLPGAIGIQRWEAELRSLWCMRAGSLARPLVELLWCHQAQSPQHMGLVPSGLLLPLPDEPQIAWRGGREYRSPSKFRLFPWTNPKSWSPVISEENRTMGKSELPLGPGSSPPSSRRGPAATGGQHRGTEIRKAGVVLSFLDTLNWILKQHEMQPKILFKDYFFFQCVSIGGAESPTFPQFGHSSLFCQNHLAAGQPSPRRKVRVWLSPLSSSRATLKIFLKSAF